MGGPFVSRKLTLDAKRFWKSTDQEASPAITFPAKAARLRRGNQCRHGNWNKGMEGVPEQIESRDLVGEELNSKKHARRRNHPPTGKQMEPGRQIKQTGVDQQSQGGYRT
jgi:hypothetical protein